jgi:hypothetical protein
MAPSLNLSRGPMGKIQIPSVSQTQYSMNSVFLFLHHFFHPASPAGFLHLSSQLKGRLLGASFPLWDLAAHVTSCPHLFSHLTVIAQCLLLNGWIFFLVFRTQSLSCSARFLSRTVKINHLIRIWSLEYPLFSLESFPYVCYCYGAIRHS